MDELRKRWDIPLTAILVMVAFFAERAEWFSVVEEQTVGFRHLLRISGMGCLPG